MQAGYVRGGRSRTMRPVLIPGNRVQAEFRARTSDQLAGMTAELTHSIAPLLGEPLPAAAIDWATALTAAALPEGNAYPALYAALDGVLLAVEAAPAARGWAVALVRYEMLLLGEMGFALDLSRCSVTGAPGPARWVSPRTGAAVGDSAASGYETRLLAVPDFLAGGTVGESGWASIFDGLDLTGHFIERSVLVDRRADVLSARGRLLERLKRAVA